MANNFVDHKDRWLLISNGDFDYPIMFIKSWLPFNAWYCNNYPQYKNKDRLILEDLKVDNNLFRTRLISLLENTDEDSRIFQSNLIKLHYLLERYKVPNAIDSISFKSINFRINPKTLFLKPHRNHNYKIEILTPIPPNNYKVRIDILNAAGSNIFLYQHSKYDKSHLLADAGFIGLTNTHKNVILSGFDDVNPKLKESLIESRKSNSLQSMSEVLFRNNSSQLAQGVIEILYKLRCILFHGEIQPNKDNLTIYEPAFYMLKQLIKSLN